ncbi:hypothetical protein QUA86_31720 [Microcoleus sp. F6_B6]
MGSSPVVTPTQAVMPQELDTSPAFSLSTRASNRYTAGTAVQ